MKKIKSDEKSLFFNIKIIKMNDINKIKIIENCE